MPLEQKGYLKILRQSRDKVNQVDIYQNAHKQQSVQGPLYLPFCHNIDTPSGTQMNESGFWVVFFILVQSLI